MTARRPGLPRFGISWLAAWLVLAGVILSRYADLAVPPDFVLRPLAVAACVALPIAAVALLAGRHAAIVAAATALVAALAHPAVAVTAVVSVVVLWVARRRRWTIPATQTAALLVAGVLVVIGLARAIAVTSLPFVELVSAGSVPVAAGPPTYLVLLDGYPRVDTLAELEIDNAAFIAALEARGFDHYPRAESRHGWTHKTLLALITGRHVPDTWSSVEETREIRAQLVVPEGFLAIDPRPATQSSTAGSIGGAVGSPTSSPSSLRIRPWRWSRRTGPGAK